METSQVEYTQWIFISGPWTLKFLLKLKIMYVVVSLFQRKILKIMKDFASFNAIAFICNYFILRLSDIYKLVHNDLFSW